MRLNKFLAESGACSRREADRLIEQGRVCVNGRIAQLGTQVEQNDAVTLDQHVVERRRRAIYLALNKPVGIECTTDPRVPGNIVDFVDHPQRVFPVGRLDKDSQGLILLTNDGDIVNHILRAENRHEKEYLVELDRPISQRSIDVMAAGVHILGVLTQPCVIRRVNRTTLRFVLTQGLNRQIRRMCASVGFQVRSLTRIRIMDIHLGHLRAGKWRLLTPAEIKGIQGGEVQRSRSSAAVSPSLQRRAAEIRHDGSAQRVVKRRKKSASAEAQ